VRDGTALTVAGEPRSARHYRRFRWRGAVGAVLLGPAALVSTFSTPLVSNSSWWGLAARTAAWTTFLAGAGLRFWATLYLGGRKEDALVSDGPYSVLRHPLYLGSLLIGLSAGLFLQSPLFELALAVVFVIYTGSTIPIEESVLRSRYETEFEEYIQRVPRLWPAWRQFHTPPQLMVDVQALRNEAARATRWVWIPIAAQMLTFLRAEPWWPHIFHWF